MKIVDPKDIDFLPPETLATYPLIGQLPDGRYCGIHRLLYHWTMHVDLDEFGYADKYCFATQALAVAALINWNGEGDPDGWHRHLKTGRRRNLETGEEWIQW